MFDKKRISDRCDVFVVVVIDVVVVIVDLRNLTIKFGQIGSVTAEILLTLSF